MWQCFKHRILVVFFFIRNSFAISLVCTRLLVVPPISRWQMFQWTSLPLLLVFACTETIITSIKKEHSSVDTKWTHKCHSTCLPCIASLSCLDWTRMTDFYQFPLQTLTHSKHGDRGETEKVSRHIPNLSFHNSTQCKHSLHVPSHLLTRILVRRKRRRLYIVFHSFHFILIVSVYKFTQNSVT